MAVEQSPVGDVAGPSGTAAMDVDTGTKSRYVVMSQNVPPI